MNLEDQSIISLLVAENEEQFVLTATENGFGKRTPITEYTATGAAPKALIAIKPRAQRQSRRRAVGRETIKIMLITQGAASLVRTESPRFAWWVARPKASRLIGLDDSDVLSGVQKVMMSVDEEDETDTDAADEATPTANDADNGRVAPIKRKRITIRNSLQGAIMRPFHEPTPHKPRTRHETGKSLCPRRIFSDTIGHS